jgi:hypothetical protein
MGPEMLILSTKLKNRFKDADIVQLRNIRVNDDKRGCSGFIQKGQNIVYVNTERCFNLGYMYRTADTLKDYTGGQNQWAKDIDSLVNGINKLLNR